MRNRLLTSASALLVLVLGAAAPVASRPVLQPFGGRSILTRAVASCHERTLLVLRNVGDAGIRYRLVWFGIDGSVVGRSDPRYLEKRAAIELDLGGEAHSMRFFWSGGAVHVEWVSETFSRMTATATVVRHPFHTQMDVENVSQLTLDDEGPRPIRWAEFQDIAGR